METTVVVRKESGETIPARAVNISSSGMLVRLEGPLPFHVGETVTVEVQLSSHSDRPFSSWGIGQVVRLDGRRSAIHLRAGSFHRKTTATRRNARSASNFQKGGPAL